MSADLKLRARFPTGETVTLSLPPRTSFGTLVSTLQTRASLAAPPSRVLLAGRPPRALGAADTDAIGDLLRSGDALIVETGRVHSGVAQGGRARRVKKSMVQKAAEALQRRADGAGGAGGAAGGTRARVASLAMVKRAGGDKAGGGREGKRDDDDDVGDVDWAVDADCEGEEQADAARRGKKGAGRAERGAQKGGGRGMKRRRKGERAGGEDWFDPLGLRAAQGDLAAALVRSMTEERGDVEAGGRALKKSMQEALRVREREAAGERRVEAYLGKTYRWAEGDGDGQGNGFGVEYRAVGERQWRREAEMLPALGKDVVRGVLEEVVRGGQGELLEAGGMARVSPVVFWNMVRLYEGEGGVEAGVKDLMPGVEVGGKRKRTLSAKAKRNLENRDAHDPDRDAPADTDAESA